MTPADWSWRHLARACWLALGLCLLPAACLAQESLTTGTWGRLPGPRVEFVTTDGVTLVGNYQRASGSTITAVMVPMIGSPRESWYDLADVLAKKGMGVLTFDLRGQGESTQSTSGTVNYRTFRDAPDGEWGRIPGDIGAAVSYLVGQGVAPNSILLFGASVGANAVVLYAADGPALAGCVLLSPGEDYRGLKPLERIGALRCPVLLTYEFNDKYATQSGERMKEVAEKAGVRLALYTQYGVFHGTAMLKAPVLAAITTWLENTFR